MSKTPQLSVAENQTATKGAHGRQLVSFFSGAIFVSVVVIYTLSHNQQLRSELERQIRIIIQNGQSAATQIRLFTQKIQELNALIKSTKADDAEAEPIIDLVSPVDNTSYDQFWQNHISEI